MEEPHNKDILLQTAFWATELPELGCLECLVASVAHGLAVRTKGPAARHLNIEVEQPRTKHSFVYGNLARRRLKQVSEKSAADCEANILAVNEPCNHEAMGDEAE